VWMKQLRAQNRAGPRQRHRKRQPNQWLRGEENPQMKVTAVDSEKDLHAFAAECQIALKNQCHSFISEDHK